MSIQNAFNKQKIALASVGRAVLNAKYPNEFEMYVCALELVDDAGRTLRYFIFPVNPSNLEETEPKITSIKKTMAGISSLSNPTFVPPDITLSGSFGRKFRILLGTDYVDFIQSFRSDGGAITLDSAGNGIISTFDERTKTGYGCLKILQEIIRESDTVDENGGRRLIFYNPVFGSAYIVKATNFKIAMSQESNMIHNYMLSLKGIAPLSAIQSSESRESEAKKLNSTALIQSAANNLKNTIMSVLKKI